MAGQMIRTPSMVQAKSVNTTGDFAEAGTGTLLCSIDQVNVFSNHIHVHCTTATPTGVSFFAFPTDSANAAEANRILMLANTAFSLGNSLGVGYDDDVTHNVSGCLGDCRNIVWVSLRP